MEIFTDKSLFNEEDFVMDNESFFLKNPKNDEVAAHVIEAIEEGKYLDCQRFYDRFGVAVYNSCMSTGAKTLINIASSNKVINGNELGANAREYMLWCIDGKVFIEPSGCVEIEGDLDLSRIRLNNNPVTSIDELEGVL